MFRWWKLRQERINKTILIAVAAGGEDLLASTIAQILIGTHGRKAPSFSTVYTRLDAMVKKGWLTENWKKFVPDIGTNGPITYVTAPRRVFTISEAGLAYLETSFGVEK